MVLRKKLMSSVLVATLAAACGKSKSSSSAASVVTPTDTQVPTQTPVTPVVTPAPAAPVAKYWIASAGSGGRLLAGLSADGKLVQSYDFSNQLTGAITALAFADSRRLLMFVDPGASGEVVASLDIVSGVLTNNLISSAALTNSTVNDMVVTGGNNVYVTKQVLGGTERFVVDFDNVFNTRYAAPYPIGATVGACTASTINQIVLPMILNGASVLAQFGSGAASRINLLSGLDTTLACGSTTNVGTAGLLPTSATTIPSGAFLDAAASQLYVRYSGTAAPMGIYKYDYNATTGALALPAVGSATVYTNLGILGVVAASRGIAELDANTFIVPEQTANVIHKISKAGSYIGVFHKSVYSTAIAAMAVRP